MPDSAPDSSSTIDVPLSSDAGPAAVWLRRAFLSLLFLVVVAGLLGFLGVRSRTVVATANDHSARLSVHYAQVARAGLDVPFDISVERAQASDRDVVVAVPSSYLDLFDISEIEPEPTSSTATATSVIWHFDAPPRHEFTVSVDMQVQGGRHFGRSGFVSLLDGKTTVAHVSFHTWLSP
jgi:hypothetical protein